MHEANEDTPAFGLALDIDTICQINDRLKLLLRDGQPLDKVHGSFTVDIIGGRFHAIRVADSFLLSSQGKKRKRQRSA
jgi:hypothetical protein